MVTSLYTSADMKIDFNVSFEPADFGNLRVIMGYFFKANPTVRSLYTSADPMDGFQNVRGHFGVVRKYPSC